MFVWKKCQVPKRNNKRAVLQNVGERPEKKRKLGIKIEGLCARGDAIGGKTLSLRMSRVILSTLIGRFENAELPPLKSLVILYFVCINNNIVYNVSQHASVCACALKFGLGVGEWANV